MFRGLLLAAPGAGKGTQGERLAERYEVLHLATGDLLRSHVSEGTELGVAAKSYMEAGELVPDDLVVDMVRERIGGADPLDNFLLDGFPRTIGQAEYAYDWGQLNGKTFHAVIMLDVPDEELVRRLVERGKTSGRSDDNEAVIRERLRVYRENTEPLISFYEDRGILHRVDGTGSVDDVTARIAAVLDPIVAA